MVFSPTNLDSLYHETDELIWGIQSIAACREYGVCILIVVACFGPGIGGGWKARMICEEVESQTQRYLEAEYKRGAGKVLPVVLTVQVPFGMLHSSELHGVLML